MASPYYGNISYKTLRLIEGMLLQAGNTLSVARQIYNFMSCKASKAYQERFGDFESIQCVIQKGLLIIPTTL